MRFFIYKRVFKKRMKRSVIEKANFVIDSSTVEN